MPEIKSINSRGANVPFNSDPSIKPNETVRGPKAPFSSADTPVGKPGPLGQPTGMPAPTVPGETQILPDVLIGRDPSQMVAAEHLRGSGGASAIEELLGLNLQPSIIGAFPPPPGNSEALRHMTPTMRRMIVSTLLARQRHRLGRLSRLLREDGERGESDDDSERGTELAELLMLGDAPRQQRAGYEIGCAARMLNLLDELLAMQDYTLSQMGTFSHG